MRISKDPKDILKKEIERLEGQNAIAIKRIKALGSKRDAFGCNISEDGQSLTIMKLPT